MAEIIDIEQTSMWPEDDRSPSTCHGYIDPSFVSHVGKTIVSHLWRGDTTSMKLYVAILKQTLEAAPWLASSIKEPYAERVGYVMKCLDENIAPIPWVKHADGWAGSIDVRKAADEASIVNALIERPELLKIIAGNNQIDYMVKECPTAGGRADLRFHVGRTLHVIEVKAVCAGHKVVGQIQKYLRDVGSLPHQGTHEYVSGWVLAPDITQDAKLELQMSGVRMIKLLL